MTTLKLITECMAESKQLRLALGIAIETSDGASEEAACMRLFAEANGIPWRYISRPEDVPHGWVASGSARWTEAVLQLQCQGRGGNHVTKPDYYPAFLAPWLKRKTWETDTWPRRCGVFVKPADRHKRFTGFVTRGSWRDKKKGPFVCSEVVTFTDEWRYYVENGRVVAAEWYSGAAEGSAPRLDIEWPPDFCGAVDFGRFPSGDIGLIEANPPYSCGWYGPRSEFSVFARWILHGWQHELSKPFRASNSEAAFAE
jgi:hypothetical protein